MIYNYLTTFIEVFMSVETISCNIDITNLISEKGYAIVKGTNFKIPNALQNSFSELATFYSQLPNSNSTMRGFGTKRRLDSGEFVMDQGTLKPLKQGTHSMAVAIFENKKIYENAFLQSLIEMTLKTLPNYQKSDIRNINILMTRHDSSVPDFYPHQDNALDDPEGIEWVVQYNIHRSSTGIKGGEIQIIDKTDRTTVKEQCLLKDPLDSYFLRDTLFRHSATAITVDEENPGVRDILVIRPRKKK
jgi:hypothetical protein